jgi:hypothetical protein
MHDSINSTSRISVTEKLLLLLLLLLKKAIMMTMMTSAHIDITSSTASFRRIDHRKVGHESNPYSDRSIHNGW